MSMKQCYDCNKTKDLNLFYPEKHHRFGVSGRCIECTKRYNSSDHKKALNKAAYQRNRDVIRERKRKQQYKWVYGLEYDVFEEMVKAQNNLCYLCHKPPAKTTKRNQRLFVDHDHTSQKVRGLLCSSCNFAIGLVKEDTGLLHRMIDYLDKHGAKCE